MKDIGKGKSERMLVSLNLNFIFLVTGLHMFVDKMLHFVEFEVNSLDNCFHDQFRIERFSHSFNNLMMALDG